MEFILIFQNFLRPKNAIKGFICQGTRAALTWRHCHMAVHQQAIWTGKDSRGCLRGVKAEWAKGVGPTGIVGLSIG